MSIHAAAAAAAAAAEPDPGWGNLVGLLVAAAVFWAFKEAHKRWLSTRDTPSPTAIEGATAGAKPQAKAKVTPLLTPPPVGPGSGSKELDVFVAQQAGKARTMDIVREAHRRFGASRRTVLRAIKRAQGGAS